MLRFAVNDISKRIEAFENEISKRIGVEFVGDGRNLKYLFKFQEALKDSMLLLFTEEEVATLEEDDLMAELVVRAATKPKEIYSEIFADIKNLVGFKRAKVLIVDDDIDDVFLLVELKSDCIATV